MIEFLKRFFSKKDYKFKKGEKLFALNLNVDGTTSCIVTTAVKKTSINGYAAYVCGHRGRRITWSQKVLTRPAFANGCKVKVKGSDTFHRIVGIAVVEEVRGYQLIKLTKKGKPFANGNMYQSRHSNIICDSSNYYDMKLNQYLPMRVK